MAPQAILCTAQAYTALATSSTPPPITPHPCATRQNLGSDGIWLRVTLIRSHHLLDGAWDPTHRCILGITAGLASCAKPTATACTPHHLCGQPSVAVWQRRGPPGWDLVALATCACLTAAAAAWQALPGPQQVVPVLHLQGMERDR
jgi:hypothetical protein